MVAEASDEEPCIFNSVFLFMFEYLAGDEQQLDDVFMHIDKEMKLLEKVANLEDFLIDHVFIDLGDNEETVVTWEVDKYN